MIDALGPNTILGYCTNVHPAQSLDQVRANLDRYAAAVQQQLCPDQPMGVGLWFADSVTRELVEGDTLAAFGDFVASRDLKAFTLNGFPFGNFHQNVVKQAVYEPDWTTDARLDYTLRLADILRSLIGDDVEGSISTLPIGWPGGNAPADRDRLAAAARQLARLVEQLAADEARTGKLIHVDLEPEPGCLLDTADDVCAFFESDLLDCISPDLARRYLRVCHDVCHSAVMFEPQRDTLACYAASGIAIGKVQLSCALAADAPLAELHGFAEDRYLHQTSVRIAGGRVEHFTDLPHALAAQPAGDWRVHFHVPVYAESLGPLGTTQNDLREFLASAPALDCRHYEVETYAWNVLPEVHREIDLAAGIAREMQWVIDTHRSHA